MERAGGEGLATKLYARRCAPRGSILPEFLFALPAENSSVNWKTTFFVFCLSVCLWVEPRDGLYQKLNKNGRLQQKNMPAERVKIGFVKMHKKIGGKYKKIGWRAKKM